MEQRDDKVSDTSQYKEPSMYKTMVDEQMRQFKPNAKEDLSGKMTTQGNDQRGP